MDADLMMPKQPYHALGMGDVTMDVEAMPSMVRKA